MPYFPKRPNPRYAYLMDITPNAAELHDLHPEIGDAPANSVESLVRAQMHEATIRAVNRFVGLLDSDNESVRMKVALYLIERVAPSTSGERDKDSWREFFGKLTAAEVRHIAQRHEAPRHAP